MIKKPHKNDQVWLCDADKRCTRCRTFLTKTTRPVRWHSSLGHNEMDIQTERYVCPSCKRTYVIRDNTERQIGLNKPIIATEAMSDHIKLVSHGPKVPLSLSKHTKATPEITMNDRTSISKKERNLLFYSQIEIEESSWLHEFLKQHERVRQEDIYKLPQYQKNFIRDMIGEVLQRASQEWAGDSSQPTDDLGDDKESWTTCSLCGQRNRYMFFIVNRLNHIKLNVGSECIKEFDFDLKAAGGTVTQLKADMLRTQRKTRLNNTFPRIASIINAWRRGLDLYPVVIPLKLEKSYLDCGTEVTKVYDEYVKKKIGDEAFPKLRSLLQEREQLLREMDSYVATCDQKSPFTATRSIADWLISQGDRQTLQWLKEDGMITHRSVCRIMAPDLMKAVAIQLNPMMIKYLIRVSSHDDTGYIFSLVNHDNIRLHVRHRDLLMEYGDWLFGKGAIEITTSAMVVMSKIYGQRSVEHALLTIGKVISYSGYSIEEHDSQYNELDILDENTKMYGSSPHRVISTLGNPYARLQDS